MVWVLFPGILYTAFVWPLLHPMHYNSLTAVKRMHYITTLLLRVS